MYKTICVVLNLKELEDLNEIERQILLICGDATKLSTNCHVPLKAIKIRLRNTHPKVFKKAFNTLRSNGFIIKHPVSRAGVTYKLSPKGLKAINTLLRDS